MILLLLQIPVSLYFQFFGSEAKNYKYRVQTLNSRNNLTGQDLLYGQYTGRRGSQQGPRIPILWDPPILETELYFLI